MTAQAMEKIFINGEEHYMATEPLASYLSTLNNKPKFFSPKTSCWRGYYGTWEIRDDKLYLIDLEGYIANLDKREYWKEGMDFIFPNQKKVFANWFSGEIRIPQGEMLNYVHGGYLSTYEMDLFMEFKDGQLIGQRTIDNYLEEAKRIINEVKKMESIREPENSKKSLISRIRRIFKKNGNSN